MITLRDYQSATLTDTRYSFKSGSHRPLICLPCGAGKTVMFAFMAQSSQTKGKTVWFLVHRRELLDQTVETFERFQIPMKTIHIGMVATVANHLDHFPKPDFIIFDEAHFSMANTWQKIIKAFPDAYMVGLTATPARLDGKPLGGTYDKLIVGVSTRELIDQGYLSDFRYFAPSVADLSGLKKKGSDFDYQSAEQILTQRVVFGDVIKHYRTYADGLQTICYCSSISHSERMAEEFQASGINAVHFDGNTPAAQRTDIISRFRSGEIKILCNVDLISVGFDVSDCWCCILLRPTMSTALFIQQACRALRPQPGKIAVILDHVGNYTRHGLPDDDREWSLDSSLKPPREYGEDGKLLIRQCPNCYFTYKSAPACPMCGYKSELTRQEIKNVKEIRLQEVKHNRAEKAAETVKTITSIDDCKNISEIMAWCKQNGRKPGYGYYRAKARGLIN